MQTRKKHKSTRCLVTLEYLKMLREQENPDISSITRNTHRDRPTHCVNRTRQQHRRRWWFQDGGDTTAGRSTGTKPRARRTTRRHWKAGGGGGVRDWQRRGQAFLCGLAHSHAFHTRVSFGNCGRGEGVGILSPIHPPRGGTIIEEVRTGLQTLPNSTAQRETHLGVPT